jgi:hypothetical protein
MWNYWQLRNPVGLCLAALYLPIASAAVLYSSLYDNKEVLSIVASIAALPAMLLVELFGNPNPLMTVLIAFGPLQIPIMLALSAIIIYMLGYMIGNMRQFLTMFRLYIVLPMLISFAILNMLVHHLAP